MSITTAEAESAVKLNDVKIEKEHAGYTGSGYLNYGGKGSFAVIALAAAVAGTNVLNLRYANGSNVARPLEVNVGGVKTLLQMPPTGGWEKWGKVSLDAKMVAGTNPVTITATQLAGGPNLDLIEVGSPDVPAPATGGMPSQASTGVVAGTMIKAAPSTFAIKSGTVYSGLQFTGLKRWNLPKGQSATFINCKFNGNRTMRCVDCGSNEGELTFINCEFENSTAEAVYGSHYAVKSSYIHDIGGDGFKALHDVLIQGNYATRLGTGVGSHADFVQISGGYNVTIVGNYANMPIGVAGTSSNAAVFIQGGKNGERPSNILIQGNWFRGGNYTIHAFDSDQPASIRIVANFFFTGGAKDGTSARYGARSIQQGVVWTENHVFETGKLLAAA